MGTRAGEGPGQLEAARIFFLEEENVGWRGNPSRHGEVHRKDRN